MAITSIEKYTSILGVRPQETAIHYRLYYPETSVPVHHKTDVYRYAGEQNAGQITFYFIQIYFLNI